MKEPRTPHEAEMMIATEVEQECRRFLARLKEWRDSPCSYQNQQRAAMRRASLDVSVALSKFRKARDDFWNSTREARR